MSVRCSRVKYETLLALGQPKGLGERVVSAYCLYPDVGVRDTFRGNSFGWCPRHPRRAADTQALYATGSRVCGGWTCVIGWNRGVRALATEFRVAEDWEE